LIRKVWGVFRKFWMSYIIITMVKSENTCNIFGMYVDLKILCIICNIILMFYDYCFVVFSPRQNEKTTYYNWHKSATIEKEYVRPRFHNFLKILLQRHGAIFNRFWHKSLLGMVADLCLSTICRLFFLSRRKDDKMTKR
jgi:hypothetical protein